MMGRQGDYQQKLFVTGFNLDKRIRKDHPLRKIHEKIDFDFIYKEAEDTYGHNVKRDALKNLNFQINMKAIIDKACQDWPNSTHQVFYITLWIIQVP